MLQPLSARMVADIVCGAGMLGADSPPAAQPRRRQAGAAATDDPSGGELVLSCRGAAGGGIPGLQDVPEEGGDGSGGARGDGGDGRASVVPAAARCTWDAFEGLDLSLGDSHVMTLEVEVVEVRAEGGRGQVFFKGAACPAGRHVLASWVAV